jgi:hypothetical protein
MAIPRWIRTGLLATSCAACSGALSPPPTALPAAPPPTPARRAAPSSTDMPAAAAPTGPAAEPPASAAPAAPKVFPPAGFAPLHARTAQPGDGVWSALPEGARGGPAVLVQATAHPDTIKPHIYVAIVAIDLTRIELRLVAGTIEPASKAVPPERRTGLIPAADQADLIAVFNGGFMARHGQYGMMVSGDLFIPPHPDACTVALARDGGIRIRTFTEIASRVEALTAFRQTPPCLIEQGALHPQIDPDPRPRKWGAAENGDVEIRRSALGVDASGKVLFYGLGEWVTAKAIADAMKAAGAVDAAELDINWSYTRFLFFGRPSPEEPLQVLKTLIPKTKHSREGYVKKPSERDFFYLKRAGSPAAP